MKTSQRVIETFLMGVAIWWGVASHFVFLVCSEGVCLFVYASLFNNLNLKCRFGRCFESGNLQYSTNSLS